jgi:hypothetical protein
MRDTVEIGGCLAPGHRQQQGYIGKLAQEILKQRERVVVNPINIF